jgi:chromosome segregation ATPase
VNTIDMITAWHEELTTELAAAEAALLALQTEHDAAGDALQSAERDFADMRTVLAAISRRSHLIDSRARLLEDARTAASGRRVRTAGQLLAVRDQIRELKAALGQLDQVRAPALPDATEEAA